MGYLRSFLFAAPLLLTLPAHAQQAEEAAPVFTLPPSSAAQPANPRQQGPELDLFRAPATTAPPPPMIAPTVTPTPTPALTQPTAQAQRPTPAPTPRTTPAPAPPSPAANDERAAPSSESAPATPPVLAPEPEPEPQPVPTPSAAAPAEAPLSPAAPTDTTPWPWIIGVGIALLALAAALLLRRLRQPVTDEAEADIAPADPGPVATQPKPTPAPTPQPAPEPAPVAVTPDRPWLDVGLDLTQARYSLMGMTVGYTLLLHNRGDTPAQDVLVRGIIGNAGAEQQALLQSFFAQQSGLPLHAAVSIMPGETRRLTGELRLHPEQIVPVTMGQRSLLIPLAAFDASYRWGPEEAEPLGHGRTARAFILGQEQEPPVDRLAPFRLDQGPRQYRRAATRAAGELVPS
jgi:hypothetical protein